MWEEVSSKCLAKLKILLDGLNKRNKELTSNRPAFLTVPRPINCEVETQFTSEDRKNLDSNFQNLLTKVSSALSRLPLVRLMMREIPFASTWRLFSSGGTNQVVSVWTCDESSHQTGQAVIWATEVIGILALSSYTEDRLGAVQQSLGKIISVIDETIVAIETHFKLVGLTPPSGCLLSSKVNTYRSVPEDVTTVDESAPAPVQTYRYASDANLPWRIQTTLRWALVSCLKRFGQHLKTLQLDSKRRTKLERLMENIENKSETH
ncbi:hypothetical protein Aperf_G00000130483 [Anoplocephala perfoliata]